MKERKPVEIYPGIYWVGMIDHDEGLHCNPYLIIDNNEAVLIDPGSVLDFEVVYENVCSLVSPDKIKYIVLNHQDPDFCSAVPLLEEKGIEAKVATHWRTATLVKYYGIKSKYYYVNENGHKLELSSGRIIRFIPTPYLHFPGAITTYDEKSKILFSSDLFGAYANNWILFADDNYIESMKVFHEHYMPSNDILRPVMEQFLTMDISIIAPQHGSIIKENIREYILALRDLECGSFLNPIRKTLTKNGGYLGICNQVLKRLFSVYDEKEVISIFEGTEIILDYKNRQIIDFNCSGMELWDKIFDNIYLNMGVKWLTVIEPLVKKISKEYDVPLPDIYQSWIAENEAQTFELSNKNRELLKVNEKLQGVLIEVQNKLIRCPVTALYNEQFFANYFQNEFEQDISGSVLYIDIDNHAKFNFEYGNDQGNETLIKMTYILNQNKSEGDLIFRLSGALFCFYLPMLEKNEALVFAEKIRNEVENSSLFLEKTTVSISIVAMEELQGDYFKKNNKFNNLTRLGLSRLKMAKKLGQNMVCATSEATDTKDLIGKILVVDYDEMNLDLLKTALENLDYGVITAKDGESALGVLESENIDLVISEEMIPKIDGFFLREKMREMSTYKNIPFILMSHHKDENGVHRAFALEIDNFLQKPFMLSEMLGIVKNRIRGERIYGNRN